MLGKRGATKEDWLKALLCLDIKHVNIEGKPHDLAAVGSSRRCSAPVKCGNAERYLQRTGYALQRRLLYLAENEHHPPPSRVPSFVPSANNSLLALNNQSSAEHSRWRHKSEATISLQHTAQPRMLHLRASQQ